MTYNPDDMPNFAYAYGIQLPFGVITDIIQDPLTDAYPPHLTKEAIAQRPDFSFSRDATTEEISNKVDAYLASVLGDYDLLTSGWEFKKFGPHTEDDRFHISVKRLELPETSPGAEPDGVPTSEELAQIREALYYVNMEGQFVDPHWNLLVLPSNNERDRYEWATYSASRR